MKKPPEVIQPRQVTTTRREKVTPRRKVTRHKQPPKRRNVNLPTPDDDDNLPAFGIGDPGDEQP
jgi:hypothetical protein